MKVRFTPEARLAVREKRAWWEQHREKAPGFFVHELGVMIGKQSRYRVTCTLLKKGGLIYVTMMAPTRGVALPDRDPPRVRPVK